MARIISLKDTFGDDAEEVKAVLMMFGGQDAEIISTGHRVTGSELARSGAAKAMRHANETAVGWSDKAFDALMAFVAQNRGRFQAEDVRNWARHVPPAPNLRAWGNVMVRAAKEGLIKAVGYERVNNPLAHSTPATVWSAVDRMQLCGG
jgi:hypothetical protein